jgi:hypothetical protein
MYSIQYTMEKVIYGTDMDTDSHTMEKVIYGTDMDTDSHTELGWLWLSVFCSVHGESVLEYIPEVFVKEIFVRPVSISAT